MSIRKDFIDYTSSFSGILPLDTLCVLTGQNFILPFYHIVSDEPCAHVENLYRFKSVREFEKDLDYLTRHYEPIGADTLPDVLAGRYKGKKIMLLTFDDGLRQMYDIVAPILLRRGIPAVFFLNTDFIDNRGLMFRYKASLIKNFDKDSPATFLSRSDTELRHDVSVSYAVEIDHIVETFLKDYRPYLSSEQIKSLIGQGFTIGAHSCSHPYYEDISLDEQLKETTDCLEILRSNFGVKEKLFAFPFTDHGVSKAFFDRIFDSGAVEYSFGGAGIKNDIDPRQRQRTPMEGWDASAEQILKSEYLYYMLRAPLGKNRIKRN